MIDFSDESHDDDRPIDAKTRALIELGVFVGAAETEVLTRLVQSAVECNASANEIAMATCVGTAIKAYMQMLENFR